MWRLVCVRLAVWRRRGRHPIWRVVGYSGSGMAHEIAKLVLEKAGTFVERTDAVRTALSLGMSLEEIESYLDWLDNMRFAEDSESGKRSEPKKD